MNMSACTFFNEQDKGSNLLSTITRSVLGKQNVQAKKVYYEHGRESGKPRPHEAVDAEFFQQRFFENFHSFQYSTTVQVNMF